MSARLRKLSFWFLLLASLLLWPAKPASFSLLAAEEGKLLLGLAREEITPPAGTPLSGYGRRRGRPSQGVHDPLFVRALSLTRGDETFVFVSADLLLIEEALRELVVKKVKEKIPLGEENLVLFATHTHSGSGAIGKRFWERWIGGRFNRKIFEKTTDRIAKAIIDSTQNKVPALVEWGEAEAGDLVENRMDERLAFPTKLRVIRFRGTEQKILAHFIFFAAHPTILPASNFYFSGDFPGLLTQFLEKEHAGSVALFANGAAADLRPRGLGATTPEERVRLYAEALLERIHLIDYQPISLEGVWQAKKENVKLPRVKFRVWKFPLPSFLGNRFFPRWAVFQILRAGNFLWIALPGEVASEIGSGVEERAKGFGFVPFLLGYANDYPGYVIPERYYRDRSHYEARVSFYGRKFDFFFQKTVDRLLTHFLTEKPRRFFGRKPGVLIREGPLPILYLRGTPYEMGYEHGRLLRDQIRAEKKRISRYLHKKLIVPGLSRLLVRRALSRTWKKMEPYVTYDELEELRGLADGAGISLGAVKRLHALPDLIESFCSNGVYFGPATKGGRLLHIRNLDWVHEMGVHNFAALIFYEPDWGLPYLNLGYYGFIGSLSGMNQAGISVGQIGADSTDETLRGTPMPFLLKRVLLRARDLDEAARIITEAQRTMGTNYVFADTKRKRALAIETTANRAQIFKPNDPKEEAAGYGFPMEGALLRADTALDPVIRNLQIASNGDPKKEGLESPQGSSAYDIRYKKQAELVREYYGEIGPEIARKIAQAIAPDSNIQSVVYAYPEVWVANATDDLPAAETEYYHFNYETLLETLKARAEKSL